MKNCILRRGGFEILPYILMVTALFLMGNGTAQPTGDPLPVGEHQAEDAMFTLLDDAAIMDVADAQVGQALHLDANTIAEFKVYGTDIMLRWRSAEESQWMDTQASLSTIATTHLIGVGLENIDPDLLQNIFKYFALADSPILLDSIAVIDRTYQNVFGPVAAVIIGVGMLVGVVLRALQERQRR